jgi:hypothetical protein
MVHVPQLMLEAIGRERIIVGNDDGTAEEVQAEVRALWVSQDYLELAGAIVCLVPYEIDNNHCRRLVRREVEYPFTSDVSVPSLGGHVLGAISDAPRRIAVPQAAHDQLDEPFVFLTVVDRRAELKDVALLILEGSSQPFLLCPGALRILAFQKTQLWFY